ncbi:MAG: cupin [Segetibacter sp.]|nr:cupin [Segetibacter sp.]
MNRSSFLKFSVGVVSFLTAPFALLAKQRRRVDKGFKVGTGKDRFNQPINWFNDDIFFCKVSSKDTDGHIYVYESTRVKKGGPGLHYHHEQDEWWYVLQGEFLIKVGNETYEAKAGDSVFGPRKVPHAFAKISEGDGKLLMLFQPAGKMEEFFKVISTGALSKMSNEERTNFSRAHGMEAVGPPLNY